MNTTAITHPCDELSELKAVASFVAFVTDQMSFHDAAGDMTKEDCRGLSKIMTWLGDQIGQAESAIRERLETSELDPLKNGGLPQEAFGNEGLRRAWKSGFACGLSQADKENGK